MHAYYGRMLVSLLLVAPALVALAGFVPHSRLLLNQEADVQISSKRQSFAKPNFSLYHSSDALLQEIQELAKRHSELLTVEAAEVALKGYSAKVRSITLESTDAAEEKVYGGEKAPANSKIRALLNFGQHGREPVTSEVAFRLLSTFVGEAAMREEDRRVWNELLPRLVVKVIPMENVNGRKKVEAGELCERKNGRGVDTNRNWAVDWGKKEKDYIPSEEYPGTGPFSEPEAELVRRLASDFQPHLWVNVHSGMEALFLPYDHRKGGPDRGRDALLEAPLHSLNRLILNNSCVVGSGGSAVGYLAHGTATDWMYDVLHVPLAYTFEIYGDSHAHNDDCFRMFNPTTEELFEEVVSKWTAAFVKLLICLPEILGHLPFDTLPQHVFSLAQKRSVQRLPQGERREEGGTRRQIGSEGTHATDVANPHLFKKIRLRKSLEGESSLSSAVVFRLISLLLALLLLLKLLKGHCHWQWWRWRWRWQAAFSKKKELQV